MRMLPQSHGRVTLLPHRIPPACIKCSEPDAIAAYEKYGIAFSKFVAKLTGGLKTTTRISEVEFMCSKCTWCRPDPILEHDGVTKLWYQSCKKCNERHITTELGKCAHCDLGLL